VTASVVSPADRELPAGEFLYLTEFCTVCRTQESQAALLAGVDLQWFAAEDEGRTEEPSEYKLRKAREEGRVAKSQEISGALVLLLPVITLIICAPWMMETCIRIIRFYFDRCTQAEITDRALLSAFFTYFLQMMLPIAVTAMVAGIAANIIQNGGFIFSTKPIEPKFSKILPKFGEYFRKTLFSFEGFFNVIKSIVKVVIIGFAAYLVIRSDMSRLLSLINVSLWSGIQYIAGMSAKLLVMASMVFLVIAIPDYIVQRRQFRESLKMTKQEVKEEYKMMEGDPLVKSRLRQRMHEMMNQNMAVNVPKADVIITNPTHFAVAIQWDRQTMQAPMVTAKGQDGVAQRIKEIAREAGVPIMENKPLARALYAEVEIGDIIPEDYYQALAVILAKIYAMDNAKAKSRGLNDNNRSLW
jgi:flagellar biosynthetic protein FlhB